MLSFKVLAALALVAVCAGDPLLLHKPSNQASEPQAVGKVSSGLSLSLGFLFRGLRDVNVKDRNALKIILGLKLPTTLEDTFRYAIALARGIGAVLDHFIVGLGNLLARIIAAAIKIIVCFLGSVGSKNSFICQPSFDKQFGVHKTPQDAKDLCRKYGVEHADAQVYSYIRKYTKGKGPKSVKGSREEIFRVSVDLAKLLVRLQVGKSKKTDILTIYEKLTIGVGSLAESYSLGLGVNIADNLISVFAGIFKKNGIGAFPQDYSKCKKIIQRCGKDSAPWPKYHYRANKLKNPSTSLSRGLNYLFTGIKNKVQLKNDIVTSITSLNVPKTLNDLVIFVKTVIHGLAAVINKYISHLGSLVNRIIAAILKIIFCINLSFGDRYGRSVCDPSFDQQYGAPGDADDADGVCDDYRVQDADDQLNQILDQYSGGKGLDSLQGPIKLIFQTSLDIAVILKKKESLNKKDFSIVFAKVTLYIGILGEGYLKDLGKQLIGSIFDSCNGIFQKQGIDFSKHRESVIKDLKNCNEGSPWGWSYPQDYKGADEDDDEESGATDDDDDDEDEDDDDDSTVASPADDEDETDNNGDNDDSYCNCDGQKDDDWTAYDGTGKGLGVDSPYIGHIL